jgi:hypothetical protein
MARLQPQATQMTRWQRNALIAGDVIALVLFAVIGRNSHGMATGAAAIAATLFTAAPFIVAWFLVAPWLGALQPPYAQAGSLARRTALAWLLAWPLALILRAVLLQRGIPLTFALIAGGVNLVLLVGWRSLFALFLARRSPA